MKKKPEDILYELREQVANKVFAKIGPIRKFPEDFLDEKTKKELAGPVKYPSVFAKDPPAAGKLRRDKKPLKSGIKIVGRYHKVVREKIDPKAINEALEMLKEWEKGAGVKYEEVLLPEGELKLNLGRKFEICSAKSGMTFLKFDSLEKTKYVLYCKKKGQLVYKIPKDEGAIEKAVEDYEKYLEEIREKLKKAFMKRRADRKIAEYLADEVMKEI